MMVDGQKAIRPFGAFLHFLNLILIGGVFFVPALRAQTVPPGGRVVGRPAFRLFSDRDGLPQNAIRSMTFDRLGRLWVGTKDGACVYNGKTWTTVNMPNRDQSNFVTVVREALDGGMWFGTDGGGLLLLKNNHWTVFDQGNGLPGNDVIALLETRAGPEQRPTLWVATQEGLGFREGDRWQTFTATDGLPSSHALCLLEHTEPNGSKLLLVGTTSGIGIRRGGQWEILRGSPDIPNQWVLSLLETPIEDGTRRLLAGTQGGLFSFPLSNWLTTGKGGWATGERIPTPGQARRLPPLGEAVFTLLSTTTPNGGTMVWAGAIGGLWQLRDDVWERYSTADGLPANGIWSLLESPPQLGQGTLWIGTSGGGIARWSQGGWTHLTTSNGLAGNSTYSLLETAPSDGKQSIWIGTLGGLTHFENGSAKATPSSDLGNVAALSANRDRSGAETVWAGTTIGLFEYRRGHWTKWSTAVVTSILAFNEPDGTPVVWVGTIDGLRQFRNGVEKRFTTADGLPVNRIRCLLKTADAKGNSWLWIGTHSGLALARVSGDGLKVIGIADGPAGKIIMGLLETSNGSVKHLWVGTGNGLARASIPDDFTPESIAGMKWEVLSETTVPALPNNTVYRIQEDRGKRIYLSTNKGVVRLTSTSEKTDGPLQASVIHTFAIEDGLPSNECNTGASMIDSMGRIWVGTIAGVAVLDPNEAFPDETRKPLLIEGVRFFEQTQAREKDQPAGEISLAFENPPKAGIALPHTRNNVTFRFALLSYFRESDTRYRTQLVGLEENPSDWTASTERDYTTLPGGTYLFRVWGKDSQGFLFGPTEIAFTVRSSPWRSWWALALYVGATGFIIFIGFRFRVRRLMARQQELRELVAGRTRDLTDEKERTEEALNRIRQLNEQLALANAALKDANLQERERALRAMANAQQSQLLMLRYQVNPHFLFNVLNSIWALVDENPAGIRTLVNRLSKFLRYSLTTSNTSLVTLGEEITAVRNYLEIQRIRFERKLEIAFEIEPEAEPFEIPAFLIQPLVENAIKYGMQTSTLPLRIRISAKKRNHTLTVRVANSGKWVAPSTGHREDSTGLGLNNVRQRLAEAYPEASGLRVFHRAGWVSFRLRLTWKARS